MRIMCRFSTPVFALSRFPARSSAVVKMVLPPPGCILSIAERAQEKLNDDVLSVFGVSMFNLNIYLEEELKEARCRINM